METKLRLKPSKCPSDNFPVLALDSFAGKGKFRQVLNRKPFARLRLKRLSDTALNPSQATAHNTTF